MSIPVKLLLENRILGFDFFMNELRIDVKLNKNPVIFFIKQDMLKIAMLRCMRLIFG